MHRLRVTRYYIAAGASFEPAIKRCLRDALEGGPVTILRGDGVQVVLSATQQTVDIMRSVGGELFAVQYEPGTPHTHGYMIRWCGPLTIAAAMEIFDLQWIEHPVHGSPAEDFMQDATQVTMPPATRTIEHTGEQAGPLNNIRRLEK